MKYAIMFSAALLVACSSDSGSNGPKYTVASVCEDVLGTLCHKLVACGCTLDPGESCDAVPQDTITNCCKGGCATTATGYCNECMHDINSTSCTTLLPGGPTGTQLNMPSTCTGCAY